MIKTLPALLLPFALLSGCIMVPVIVPPARTTRPADITPAPNPCPVSPETTAAQGPAFAALNAARQAQGLPALSPDPRLTKVAQDHACDMAVSLRMSHQGSDGSDLRTRLDRVGVSGDAWAENAGTGIDRAADMVAGWMQSPPHRANILTARMTNAGLALSRDVTGRPFWALVLADHP